MAVEIPFGAEIGQAMQVISPEGQEVQFVVPEGAVPGQLMSIQYQKPVDYLLLRVVEEEDADANLTEILSEVKAFTARWAPAPDSSPLACSSPSNSSANSDDDDVAAGPSNSKKPSNSDGKTSASCGNAAEVFESKLLHILNMLPLEGQSYLTKTFTLIGSRDKVLSEIKKYATNIRERKPWETIKTANTAQKEDVELKVDGAGAILGSCLEPLQGYAGLAHAHCQITAVKREGEVRYYVKDLNTTTGTFLEGEKCPTTDPGAIVYDGMSLALGDVKFSIEVMFVDDPSDPNGARGTILRRETQREAAERRRLAMLKTPEEIEEEQQRKMNYEVPILLF